MELENIKCFTVVGAGTMGRDIVQVALMSNNFKKVIMNDVNEVVLNDAEQFIHAGIKKVEKKGRLGKDINTEQLMSRLVKNTSLKESTEHADFLIEAIPEDMGLKQDLFKKAGEYAPNHAIFATNTSTMPITEIASTSGCDDRIVGTHFFTPVVLMGLIEVIKGKNTSEKTLETSINVCESLPVIRGKRVIARIEKESPGFIVNRLLVASSLYTHYIIDIADEKGIPYEQIDADVPFMDIGPCAKMDYLGLGTNYNVHKYFEKAVSTDYAPGKVVTKLVKEGKLGKKTGEGLFKWENDRPILDKSVKSGLYNMELLMAIMLNEGCRLLEEGIVSGYKIIDDAMMSGAAMPGPFGAGCKSYEKWSGMLDEFVKDSGFTYFKPCELMRTGSFVNMKK
ncbi:MAG: 3-hydroxyacyl-CoA dehydrogenase NAD-binding domain-containing protein [Candidatus Hodarchaeota archaeon]